MPVFETRVTIQLHMLAYGTLSSSFHNGYVTLSSLMAGNAPEAEAGQSSPKVILLTA
jgi:hypothetical protein